MRRWTLFLTLLLVPIGAPLAVAQRTVRTPDEIDLRPPATQGGVLEPVAVQLPAADALSFINVAETSAPGGKRYSLSNRGGAAVVLWTYSMHRSDDGTIWPIGGLTVLAPGESKTVEIGLRTSSRGAYGEYLLVYCVALKSEYYKNIPMQELTADGYVVHEFVYNKLDRRLEADRTTYKR